MSTIDPTLLPGYGVTYATPEINLTTQFKPAASRSFGRLVKAELRKLVDTRASFWVLIGGLALTVLAFFGQAAIMGFTVKDVNAHPDRYGTDAVEAIGGKVKLFDNVNGASALLLMFLVIMAIMLATSEWTTRSALCTFTLEPQRGRVLAAKTLVACSLALIIGLLALPLGAGATSMAGAIAGTGVDWSIPIGQYLFFLLTCVLGVLFGMAWGLLTLSTAFGIVLYFVIPLLFGIVSSLVMIWSQIPKVMLWIDPNAASKHLLNGTFSLTNWAAYGVTQLVWVAVPFAIGTWRWITREVK